MPAREASGAGHGSAQPPALPVLHVHHVFEPHGGDDGGSDNDDEASGVDEIDEAALKAACHKELDGIPSGHQLGIVGYQHALSAHGKCYACQEKGFPAAVQKTPLGALKYFWRPPPGEG